MDNFAMRLSQALKQMYDQAAVAPDGLLMPAKISRGLELLGNLGYPDEVLEKIPGSLAASAFPCACPLATIDRLNPTSMLDLGCGMALDCLVAAWRRPGLKRLVGLDQSEELLARAARLQQLFFQENNRQTFIRADLNQPAKQMAALEGRHFDLILCNGSFNLVADRLTFLRFIQNLCAPNGRILIYDFLLSSPLPTNFSNEIDNWLWNIGGAWTGQELTKQVKAADLEIEKLTILERIDPVDRVEIILNPVFEQRTADCL